jgi:hypothetical protein
VLDAVVLALLVLQSVVGVLALLRWRGALRAATSFPTALVAAHIVVSAGATALWVVWLASDRLAWGWAAFVVVLVGNGLGDLVLAGRWRLDQALSGRWLRGWADAARNLLDRRRRIGAAHAALAGVTTVLMLVACLVAA